MTDAVFMTHWAGCWKHPHHQECAIALIEKAEEVIVDMLTDAVPDPIVEEARKWMRWKNGLRSSADAKETPA